MPRSGNGGALDGFQLTGGAFPLAVDNSTPGKYPFAKVSRFLNHVSPKQPVWGRRSSEALFVSDVQKSRLTEHQVTGDLPKPKDLRASLDKVRLLSRILAYSGVSKLIAEGIERGKERRCATDHDPDSRVNGGDR